MHAPPLMLLRLGRGKGSFAKACARGRGSTFSQALQLDTKRLCWTRELVRLVHGVYQQVLFADAVHAKGRCCAAGHHLLNTPRAFNKLH